MKPKKAVLFSDFYQKMLDQKIAHETSPVTMSRIDVIWRKSLAPFWKSIKPKEINQDLVTKFINWHREKREGIQFVNVFKYLNNVFNVMVEAGALPIEKKPKLEIPKTEQLHHARQKGRYITDQEFQVILDHSEGWFKLFFLILFSSGFRKMELGKLEVSRLRKVGNRYVAVLNTDNTKTGRAREVPFSEVLTPLVDEQLKNGSSYLFPSNDKQSHIRPQTIDLAWKKAKTAAGIEGKMRIHDCRHSCASNLAKENVNSVVVVTNLGMSLAMFQRTYLKLKAEDLFIVSDSFNKKIGKL